MSKVHELGLVELGPRRSGFDVFVDGHKVPSLSAREDGDSITFVMDNRLSTTVPRSESARMAWVIASAMAIGAGYPSIGGERTKTFGRKVVDLGTLTENTS